MATTKRGGSGAKRIGFVQGSWQDGQEGIVSLLAGVNCGERLVPTAGGSKSTVDLPYGLSPPPSKRRLAGIGAGLCK